jgi:hypothetical protein
MTAARTVDWFPHPSPCGRHVVYLAYPEGTAGHPADLEVALRLMPQGGGPSRELVGLHGGQGTINVPSWAPDGGAFAFMRWAVIFEGHRKAPDRLMLTSDGRIALAVRSVFVVSQDGKTVQDCNVQEANTETQASFFADISSDGKGILVAGWRGFSDRFRPWVGPLVEHRSLDGTLQRRFYDWTPALVGNPAIDLLNNAPITHAVWLSTGALAVAAMAFDDATVLGVSSVDPSRALNRSEKSISPPRGTQERIHLAVFDSQNPLKGVWTQLVLPEGRVVLSACKALSGGRLLIFGEQGKTTSGGKGALSIYAGKPDAFVTIYTPELSPVLKPKILPSLRITDAQEIGESIFITGTVLSDNAQTPTTVLQRFAK